jgi:hypothetical protein
MKYPYRVKVFFDPDQKTNKIQTVIKLNTFLNHQCIGDYEKWNIMKRDVGSYSSEYVGIELGFEQNQDAVHFKLGFISDGEKIDGEVYRDYREEEKRV